MLNTKMHEKLLDVFIDKLQDMKKIDIVNMWYTDGMGSNILFDLNEKPEDFIYKHRVDIGSVWDLIPPEYIRYVNPFIDLSDVLDAVSEHAFYDFATVIYDKVNDDDLTNIDEIEVTPEFIEYAKSALYDEYEIYKDYDENMAQSFVDNHSNSKQI